MIWDALYNMELAAQTYLIRKFWNNERRHFKYSDILPKTEAGKQRVCGILRFSLENIHKALAFKPSVPRLIMVTTAVYPHLVELGKLRFRNKSPLTLESTNQAKNIPVALLSSPIKILGKTVQGFLSYDRTNKRTDKQRLQLYIYSEIIIKHATSMTTLQILFSIYISQYLPLLN